MTIPYKQLKEVLNEVITSKLESAGFVYDGEHSWYTPWDNHMRKIVTASLMKGYAILSWGIVFDFLPILSEDKRAYDTSNRKINRHLYTYPQPFIDCKVPCKEHEIPQASVASLDAVKKQTAKAFKYSKKDIFNWFSKVTTLEVALTEIERQISYGKYYNFGKPFRLYVRAFLLAATGHYDESRKALDDYFLVAKTGSNWNKPHDDKTKANVFAQLQQVYETVGYGV